MVIRESTIRSGSASAAIRSNPLNRPFKPLERKCPYETVKNGHVFHHCDLSVTRSRSRILQCRINTRSNSIQADQRDSTTSRSSRLGDVRLQFFHRKSKRSQPFVAGNYRSLCRIWCAQHYRLRSRPRELTTAEFKSLISQIIFRKVKCR